MFGREVFDRDDVMGIDLLGEAVLIQDDGHGASHSDKVRVSHLNSASIGEPDQEGFNSLCQAFAYSFDCHE